VTITTIKRNTVKKEVCIFDNCPLKNKTPHNIKKCSPTREQGANQFDLENIFLEEKKKKN